MRNLLIFLSGSLILFSCIDMSDDVLPNGTGSSGDLVVVMDSSLWSGESGQAILNCFGAVQEGLPQPEPMFNIIRTRPDNFKQIFKTTKNIVMLKTGPEFDNSKYSLDKNRWATNQLVLTVLSTNDKAMAPILENNCALIREQFLEEELKRLEFAFNKLRDEKVMSAVLEVTGERFIIPNDYKLSYQGGHSIWLRKDFEHKGHQVSMGLIFYTLDYLSEDQFEESYLMEKRNSNTVVVKGPVEGSYMKLYQEVPPLVRELEDNGRYAKELRGLWNMEKAFMGGPYIQLSFVGKDGKKMVCGDGYVFAPKFDKREYIRELEAILRSALH